MGNTVDVVIWRGNKEQTLKLRIGEQEEAEKQNASAQGGPAKKQPEPDQAVTSTIEQLGLTLQKVSDQLREKYGLSDGREGCGGDQGRAQQPGGGEAAAGSATSSSRSTRRP